VHTAEGNRVARLLDAVEAMHVHGDRPMKVAHWQCSCCGASNDYSENWRCFHCWKQFERDRDEIIEAEDGE
jgi:hypothetical protein